MEVRNVFPSRTPGRSKAIFIHDEGRTLLFLDGIYPTDNPKSTLQIPKVYCGWIDLRFKLTTGCNEDRCFVPRTLNGTDYVFAEPFPNGGE